MTERDPYRESWSNPPTAPLPVPYQQAVPPVPYHPVPYQYAVSAVPRRSAGVAVALELLLGLLGVFGVGSMYAGRVGLGIALMVSFWVLFWVNVVLIFLLIGIVTMPLTWLAYLVVGAMLAARGAERHNAGGAILH